MNREQILQHLIEERDSLTRAIEALDSGAPGGRKTSAKPAAKKRSPKGISAAGGKRLSMLMKKRWAERRKADKVK